jgi:hypothetical protein
MRRACLFFAGVGIAPAPPTALVGWAAPATARAGWALAPFGAALLEWLPRDHAPDVRLPMKHIPIERLLSLSEAVHAAGSLTPHLRPL